MYPGQVEKVVEHLTLTSEAIGNLSSSSAFIAAIKLSPDAFSEKRVIFEIILFQWVKSHSIPPYTLPLDVQNMIAHTLDPTKFNKPLRDSFFANVTIVCLRGLKEDLYNREAALSLLLKLAEVKPSMHEKAKQGVVMALGLQMHTALEKLQ